MKLFVIICFTAFLFYGVQSSGLSRMELKKRIVNSGMAVFIDFLDKVKNATEKIIKEEQFKKSRIVVQEQLKDLRRIAKQISEEDKDGSHRVKRVMLAVSAAVSSGTIVREMAGKFFHPFTDVYRENFKTETMTGIWREVESEYLKVAPPINNKPMGFLSYLFAEMVVRSGLVKALKSGVVIALEVGKIDLYQLHEEVQMVMNHVREKAAEISALERQKETNDFLASLRTASGLTVYYWDQLLKHSEILSFYEKHYDSMKRWENLTKLRNEKEKYHMHLNPETWEHFLTSIYNTFDKFFDALALKYYTVGNEVFGSDRFNQSNRAIRNIATIYGLHVYEKLTESGFGISELNSLFNRVELAIQIQEGVMPFASLMITNPYNVLSLLGHFVDLEKRNKIDDETYLPFMVIRRIVLEFLEEFGRLGRFEFNNDTELQLTEREWNHARTIFINELIKSGEFTEEELEEAQTNFINDTRGTIEKVMKYAHMAEGLDERIDLSILAIKYVKHSIMLLFLQIFDELIQ